MPTLPARYAMADSRIVFLKQYKYMAIYRLSDLDVVAVFALNTARKIWIDTSTDELVVDNGSTGSLFKTTFTMNSDAYAELTDGEIIICTGDPTNQISLTRFPLTDTTNCPNVCLKWESANSLSVFTACGNESCSVVKSECKVSSCCDAYANFT
ncbi:MAG: hypothetical protein FD123_597 [Bacteroidetes bacterium]|nr:MAG: hypothetical protein FD123_597 [Bacteroidota bacterium]